MRCPRKHKRSVQPDQKVPRPYPASSWMKTSNSLIPMQEHSYARHNRRRKSYEKIEPTFKTFEFSVSIKNVLLKEIKKKRRKSFSKKQKPFTWKLWALYSHVKQIHAKISFIIIFFKPKQNVWPKAGTPSPSCIRFPLLHANPTFPFHPLLKPSSFHPPLQRQKSFSRLPSLLPKRCPFLLFPYSRLLPNLKLFIKNPKTN